MFETYPAVAQEFGDLARGLLHGHTWLIPPDGVFRYWTDTFPHAGHTYLPFGPLPALLMIPLLPFTSVNAPTVFVGMALSVLAIFLVRRIGIARGLEKGSAMWIAFAYVFASSVFPLIWGFYSSWLAILTANVCLLAGLNEYVGRKRWLVMGSFLALAMSARLVSVAGLGAFFIWEAARTIRRDARVTFRALALLAAPGIVAVLILCAYNNARFDNPFETGYARQWKYYDWNHDGVEEQYEKLKTIGPMSFRHIPGNIPYMLWKPPMLSAHFPYAIPHAFGTGIIFTSPYLLYLAYSWRRAWREARPILLAAAFGLLPGLMHWATGWNQIGFRYAIDAYPLIFLAFMTVVPKRLPTWMKALIGVTAAMQIIWMLTAKY